MATEVKLFIEYKDSEVLEKITSNADNESIKFNETYTNILENKDELVKINVELIKKIEVLLLNIINKSDEKYYELYTNGDILYTDENFEDSYIGEYKFDSEFKTPDNEVLYFKYKFKENSQYSLPTVLLNIVKEIQNINNQINTDINIVNIEINKYLNFLVSLERSLINFFGSNISSNTSSIKNLLENTLVLKKYNLELSEKNLLVDFNINTFSRTALKNIFYNLYEAYNSLLEKILECVPTSDFQSSIRYTGILGQVSPNDNWVLTSDNEKYYTAVYKDFNNRYVSQVLDFTQKSVNSFPAPISNYVSFFNFNKLLNSNSNLISILLGTDTSNNKSNEDIIYAFDLIVNKFIKIYKDLIDDTGKPIEYLTLLLDKEIPNCIKSLEQMYSKIDDILNKESSYVSEISSLEKKLFELSEDKLSVILLKIRDNLKIMIDNINSIYSICDSLKLEPSSDGYDDDYKWYENLEEISNLSLVKNEIGIDIFSTFLPINSMKRLDKLNYPFNKIERGSEDYFIQPAIIWYSNLQTETKQIMVEYILYTPPFGWVPSSVDMAFFPQDNKNAIINDYEIENLDIYSLEVDNITNKKMIDKDNMLFNNKKTINSYISALFNNGDFEFKFTLFSLNMRYR